MGHVTEIALDFPTGGAETRENGQKRRAKIKTEYKDQRTKYSEQECQKNRKRGIRWALDYLVSQLGGAALEWPRSGT